MMECVATDYWNKPAWRELQRKILDVVRAEGYTVSQFNIFEPFETVWNIHRTPKHFWSGTLFRIILNDPADKTHYTIVLNSRSQDLKEAEQLGNILCTKLNLSTFVGVWLI